MVYIFITIIWFTALSPKTVLIFTVCYLNLRSRSTVMAIAQLPLAELTEPEITRKPEVEPEVVNIPDYRPREHVIQTKLY